MQLIVTKEVQCPYCGETIEAVIDCSIPQQDYIEDCEVCCRPINFDVTVDEDGEPYVVVSHENE